jgi:HTH-type transcriptional regulator / antitoxin HigA
MPPHPQEFVPDWSVHPGAFLRAVLEHRGIRQSELAERTGLTAKHINQIVNEAIGISGDVALLLELALNIPARTWTGLEADHQAFVSREKAKSQLPALVEWAAGFDAGTLARHGITRPGDDPAVRAEKILKFFGVASPAAFNQTWLQPRVSFRRSQSFTVGQQNTALWLRLVDRCAESATVQPLSPSNLRKVARAIPAMTTLSITDGFTAARAALAQAGVVLSFIREVPETRLCGATWWLSADRPVIGLTERQRTPGGFWFNLLHEIGHILIHPRRTTFLNLDDEKAANDAAEQEASEFAEATLLPGNTRTKIMQVTSRPELLLLAAELGIGVSVVAGQHGYLTSKWQIGGALRGRITDADIEELEAPCTVASA